MEATKKLIPLFSAIIVLIFACLLLLSSSTLADCQTTITHLPGFNGPLPFHLETGYVLVDEKEDAHMFYYFIQSENNPSDDPLTLWLTGGPGCSALSGLMWEIGPFTIDVEKYDDGLLPSLIQREYSWTKIFNIIFLDSPVGSGFSYSKTSKSKPHQTGDFNTVTNIKTFIRKWYATHQNFQRNSFYLGGDSYSGIPLPILAKQIAQSNDAGEGTPINFKGYMLGNPKTDSRSDDDDTIIPYAHRMGLISDELYELAKESCDGKYSKPNDAKCAEYVRTANKLIEWINPVHILEPNCDPHQIGFTRHVRDLSLLLPTITSHCKVDILGNPVTHNRHSNDDAIISHARQMGLNPDEIDELTKIVCENLVPEPSFDDYASIIQVQKGGCVKDLFPLPTNHCRTYGYHIGTIWVNNDSVRKALGIKKGTINTWKRCNYNGIHYNEEVETSVPYHQYLTIRGYRSLIYSGDHDMVVPFVGTEAWIRSLNYSIVKEWRPWWVDGQVGGYTRTYFNNLTFATVKGGGHTAPEYRPKECLQLIRKWLHDELV